MKIWDMMGKAFQTFSHFDTSLNAADTLFGLLKKEPKKAEKTDSSKDEKTGEKVKMAALTNDDEMNHSSMVSEMMQPEKSFYLLFKTELLQHDAFKERNLEIIFANKYFQNPEKAIFEASEIARIRRGNESGSDDFKATLIYCDAAGFTSDSNVKLLRAVYAKTSEFIKTYIPSEESIGNFCLNSAAEIEAFKARYPLKEKNSKGCLQKKLWLQWIVFIVTILVVIVIKKLFF